MSLTAGQKKQRLVYRLQFRQAWLVLFVAIFGSVLSWLFADGGLIAKGLSAGGLLAYLSQLVFTIVAYRTVSVRQANQIMLNTYLAAMLKWLISLIGFALIFLLLKPINTLAVLIGYVLLQFAQLFALRWLK